MGKCYFFRINLIWYNFLNYNEWKINFGGLCPLCDLPDLLLDDILI